MSSQIQTIISENNLSPDTALTMQKAFSGYIEKARELAKEAKSIVVTSEDQTQLMYQAREKRLELRDIRVEVEKTRKAMKEESLRTGKAIDGMANIIKFLIVPVEEHLQLQEDFSKIQEEKRKQELELKRVEELQQYEVIVDGYDLKNMPKESYKQLLENSKLAYEQRLREQAEQEKARIEAEKARIEEEKRIRLENERLKKEAEKREKIEAARRAKDQEIMRKQQEKLRVAKEAQRKIEAQLAAKKRAEEEARAEAVRVAKEEELARLKAKKEARLAPDKDKMRAAYKEIGGFITSLRQNYIFQSSEVQKILDGVIDDLAKQLKVIETKMKEL